MSSFGYTENKNVILLRINKVKWDVLVKYVVQKQIGFSKPLIKLVTMKNEHNNYGHNCTITRVK